MARCSQCNQEISCPQHQGFGHVPLDQPTVPCVQTCAIWVRAVDDQGRPVVGITAAAGGKNATTGNNGFATLEDLPEGKHTVQLGLDVEAGTLYQPLKTSSREAEVAKGELKLLTVKVARRMTPTISIAAPVVAVGGSATIQLATDLPYDGAGTFTCSKGADKLEFDPPLTQGKLEVDSGQATIRVKGLAASDLDGIAFEWTIDEASQKGDAATATLTVMTAKLELLDKRGTKIDADAVVHLQDPKSTRGRIRADLSWTPEGVEGRLKLSNSDGRLKVYDQATDGQVITEVTMTKETTTATVHVEGAKVSHAKDDAELVLDIVDRAQQVDSCKLTVVETKLVVYAARVHDTTDPLPLDEDAKADPGRSLYLQGTGARASSRALLRVLKTPIDAPCELVLDTGKDHVKLWDCEIPDKAKEQQVTTPKTLASSDFKDPAEGFVAWAEGAKLTPSGETSTFTLGVTDLEDLTDTVAFTVGLAKIEVEIVRADKQPLSKAASIGIKTKATDPASSVKSYSNSKLEFEVTPGSYLFELTPQDQEAAYKIVRTVPENSLEAALVVKEGGTTPVKFSLEPAPTYTHFQFISYELETGKYRGLDVSSSESDARKDLLGRCKIMTEAIDKTFPKADTSDTTLKVFMAPEFYFRGKQGAYPTTMLHEIMDELREHTKDPDFKHWLFVYGSAIGMLKSDQPSQTLDPVTSVTVSPPPPDSVYIYCEQAPKSTDQILEWDGKNPATACSPFTVTRSVGNIHELKFNVLPTLGPSDTLWLHDGVEYHRIPASSLKEITRLEGGFVGAAIPDLTMIEQNTSTGFVYAAQVDTGAQTCEIFTVMAGVGSGTDLALTVLSDAEIFNVVFIQRGGSGTPMNRDGSCELKELLIYKEAISSVDFAGIDYDDHAFYDKFRHVAELSGVSTRILPTQGSTDVLGVNPNVMGQNRVTSDGTATLDPTSETTTSGLGGGALFTVEGVEFGVDVCLDHACSRLKKSGSTVHVHLIPSCGMSIDNKKIAVKTKGFVFNVDGTGNGYSHTKLQCETTVITAPTPVPFAGTNRSSFFPKDGKIYVYPAQQKQW